MDVVVRMGTEKDLPFVKELAKESCGPNIPPGRATNVSKVQHLIEETFHQWTKILEKLPNAKLLILENKENKAFLGYLILLLNQEEPTTGEKQAFISDMAISPKIRGKGLWKPLLEKAEQIARENGNFYLVGMSTVTNKQSQAMAQRFGFQIERYQFCKALK